MEKCSWSNCIENAEQYRYATDLWCENMELEGEQKDAIHKKPLCSFHYFQGIKKRIRLPKPFEPETRPNTTDVAVQTSDEHLNPCLGINNE